MAASMSAQERMARRREIMEQARQQYEALPEEVRQALHEGFQRAHDEAEFIRTYRRPE